MKSPDLLSSLSREQLAQLCREYMLAAQFNSRTGYAALRINHGDEAYLDTAIDNWMAASPVYTQRMQRAMKLKEGSDVAAILKGMQLECGLSHQYFDAGFEVLSETEGQFWLNRCGPLLETEPRGEAAVKTMCHDIEDPTFDATAMATNPQARVRPVHRPPRAVPGDDGEHCRWRVYIDADAEPLQEPAITAEMRQTVLAGLVLQRPVNAEPGGLDYYDVPLFETLQFERFSHSALVVICKELAVQFHLLVNALGLAVEKRYGDDAARAIAQFQMVGSCWVISERLARWMSCEGGGLDAIARVLKVHPAVNPQEYISLEVSRPGEDTLQVSLGECPATAADQRLGWYPLLRAGDHSGLEALVRGVNRHARVEPVRGAKLTWQVVIEPGSQVQEEPLPVQVGKGTVLYSTRLDNHVELLHVSD